MLKIKINESENAARIITIGMGGAGDNAVNHMIDENIAGVEFIDINTDKRVLQFCKAPTVMQIEEKLTEGLGADTRPKVREKTVEESPGEVSQTLKGADMVFATCGMGGRTGTGAAPVIAKIAKDIRILTIDVVTKPFRFEARTRMNNALSGIKQLKNNVDTLIVISNDRLLEIMGRRTAISDALRKVDEVLQQAVQGITDLINVPGLINLDFADVQTVMIDKGITHIGIDKAGGDGKAIKAIKRAVSGPLLETTIEDADHVIINISDDISLTEANGAASYVQELAGNEANIVFDAMFDENAQDEAAIAIVATGLDEHGANAFMAEAVTGFTSFETEVPAAGAPAGQQAHAAAPEAAATASTPYTSRLAFQGYMTHGYNPAGGGQGYVAPKYSPNQGYTGDSQNSNPNSATAPNQPFRSAANKEMQINIPGFLKNKR